MDRYKSIFITLIMLTCVIAQSSPELSIKIAADSIYVNNEFCYKTKDLYNTEADPVINDTTSQLYSRLVSDNSDSTVSLLHYPNMPFDIYWKIWRYLSKSSTSSVKVSSSMDLNNVVAYNLLLEEKRKVLSKSDQAIGTVLISHQGLTICSSITCLSTVWYGASLEDNRHPQNSIKLPHELLSNTLKNDTIHEPIKALYHIKEQGYIVDSNGELTNLKKDSNTQYYLQKLGHIDTSSRKLLKSINPADIESQNISSYNLLKLKLLKLLNDLPDAPDRTILNLATEKNTRVEISTGIIKAAQEVGYELFSPISIRIEP